MNCSVFANEHRRLINQNTVPSCNKHILTEGLGLLSLDKLLTIGCKKNLPYLGKFLWPESVNLHAVKLLQLILVFLEERESY